MTAPFIHSSTYVEDTPGSFSHANLGGFFCFFFAPAASEVVRRSLPIGQQLRVQSACIIQVLRAKQATLVVLAAYHLPDTSQVHWTIDFAGYLRLQVGRILLNAVMVYPKKTCRYPLQLLKIFKLHERDPQEIAFFLLLYLKEATRARHRYLFGLLYEIEGRRAESGLSFSNIEVDVLIRTEDKVRYKRAWDGRRQQPLRENARGNEVRQIHRPGKFGLCGAPSV